MPNSRLSLGPIPPAPNNYDRSNEQQFRGIVDGLRRAVEQYVAGTRSELEADLAGTVLADLANVVLTSEGSGEILKFDGSDWINNTLAEAGISAVGHTHTEADITDLSHYTDADADARIALATLADLASASAADLDSGVLADARVQESNVTQHEAALTILESQITDGSLLARVAGNESITGGWSFQNINGVYIKSDTGYDSKVYMDDSPRGGDTFLIQSGGNQLSFWDITDSDPKFTFRHTGGTAFEIDAGAGESTLYTDLIVEGFREIAGGSILPPGYVAVSDPINFRFDQNQMAYAHKRGWTINTTPSFTADALWTIEDSFVELYGINTGGDVVIEVTGMSESGGSANILWWPFVFFHSTPSSMPNVTIEIKTSGLAGYETVVNNQQIDSRAYEIFNGHVMSAGGDMEKIKFTFHSGTIANPTYLKCIGAFSRNTDSYKWEVPIWGGTYYGDVDFVGGSLSLDSGDLSVGGSSGFYGTTPVAQPSVTGTMTSATLSQLTSVVQSLLDALDGTAGLGLISDDTT